MEQNQIIIYENSDGDVKIDVQMEGETIWLTQDQMCLLFDKAQSTISEHIKNIHKEKELDLKSCVKNIGNPDISKKSTMFYNLDVVISVGYRVKSPRGTQFRIWANSVLKDYLIKGYSIDKKRLQQQTLQLDELKQTVKLLGNVMENQALGTDEATGLLKVITDYTYALDVLDQYDHQVLKIESTTTENLFEITYNTAMEAINGLRDKFGGSQLFGNEKDGSFQGSLAAIYQTFDGQDVYPSVEEKAANLLYFVIKNHSFSDGNKRIAAFLFVWFMEKNNILYHADGSKRIADNALVALALMIAASKPDDKDMMVKVVVNLVNMRN
ncbi:RhuM family protein [Chitinophaga sp. Cy-1792]|uniref:RhuM family protein n=1 Tax=Chitinophaga sp. Cy-1792 TaxID=2608339 RepID=UPI00141FF72E|nr:RhuM family protein [Chitinophaga sp. Cy-1792]NIG56830.1 Fic/DOC family protein [Chitinophaga sp. Cy-1792]